jgi:hypothetical protein
MSKISLETLVSFVLKCAEEENKNSPNEKTTTIAERQKNAPIKIVEDLTFEKLKKKEKEDLYEKKSLSLVVQNENENENGNEFINNVFDSILDLVFCQSVLIQIKISKNDVTEYNSKIDINLEKERNPSKIHNVSFFSALSLSTKSNFDIIPTDDKITYIQRFIERIQEDLNDPMVFPSLQTLKQKKKTVKENLISYTVTDDVIQLFSIYLSLNIWIFDTSSNKIHIYYEEPEFDKFKMNVWLLLNDNVYSLLYYDKARITKFSSDNIQHVITNSKNYFKIHDFVNQDKIFSVGETGQSLDLLLSKKIDLKVLEPVDGVEISEILEVVQKEAVDITITDPIITNLTITDPIITDPIIDDLIDKNSDDDDDEQELKKIIVQKNNPIKYTEKMSDAGLTDDEIKVIKKKPVKPVRSTPIVAVNTDNVPNMKSKLEDIKEYATKHDISLVETKDNKPRQKTKNQLLQEIIKKQNLE